MESLEARLVLSGDVGSVFAELSDYEGQLYRVRRSTEWIDFTGFDADQVYGESTNPAPGQSFDNVFDSSATDPFLWNADIRIEGENRQGLCENGGCLGYEDGLLDLTQQANMSDTFHVQANSMHQYVVQIYGARFGETVNVTAHTDFQTEADIVVVNGGNYVTTNTYSNGNGVTLNGVSVTDTGPAPVTLLTSPSTQLIIEYSGDTWDHAASIRIGRFELGTEFRVTPADNTLDGNIGSSGQGMATDGEGNLYASGFVSGNYDVTHHDVDGFGDYSDGDSMFSSSAHFGAIDHSDGDLLLGRFEGIDLDNDGDTDLRHTDVKRYEVNGDTEMLSATYLFNSTSGNGTVVCQTSGLCDIDAVAIDGNELWVSAYVGSGSDIDVLHSGFHIVRYDLPSTPAPNVNNPPTILLSGGEVVARLPWLVGHDLKVGYDAGPIDATWTMTNRAHDRVLHVDGGNAELAEAGTTGTAWHVKEMAQGVTLQNALTGGYLTSDNWEAFTVNSPNANSYWTIVENDDNSISLQNNATGRYLDGDGAGENWDVDESLAIGEDDGWFVTDDNGVSELSRTFAQGLRVVNGPDGERRLFAMLTSVNACGETTATWCQQPGLNKFEPMAYSGVYEFDISDTLTSTTPRGPSRMWHLPERILGPDSEHLEGLDFLKQGDVDPNTADPGMIDGSGTIHSGDSAGRTVKLVELNNLFVGWNQPVTPVGPVGPAGTGQGPVGGNLTDNDILEKAFSHDGPNSTNAPFRPDHAGRSFAVGEGYSRTFDQPSVEDEEAESRLGWLTDLVFAIN